jgi:hypothetical protein
LHEFFEGFKVSSFRLCRTWIWRCGRGKKRNKIMQIPVLRLSCIAPPYTKNIPACPAVVCTPTFPISQFHIHCYSHVQIHDKNHKK